ncbi:MAG TPA: hypothetical protein VFG42_11925 [Baekduia sp.]|uniref:hypothetical protein n=1 Tax=Baekduia sp. TaxID=2600305 RepID=UPI002D764F26|nr:hypothetical protein [Baekduia sp.]HET6507486.1 hypothetical protein [Baekduia sp.]
MTDFIAGLEQDLIEAARRRAARTARAPSSSAAMGGRARSAWPRHRRPPLRSLLLAAALLVLLAGTAAAGTLLALRGSVIPAPDAVPPEQTPAPGTSRVSSIRAADPQPGLLPWTIRVAQSETGLLCSTVGQVDPADGAFGLVGLDGRFRPIAEGVSDSCGTVHDGGVSLIGARVFDAAERADVRTVVSGVGDRRAIARVEVDTRPGGPRRVRLVDGMFVIALRGYPEDRAVRATVIYKNGKREVHDFGRGASVTPDPLGGPAWRLQAFMFANDGRSCASFGYARPTRDAPRSPAACGDLGSGLHRKGFYVAARTLRPGLKDDTDTPFSGDWHRTAPRTAVWGGIGEDVRTVAVDGRPVAISPSRTFLVVLRPTVDPASVATTITYKNGRAETVHGSARIAHDAIPTPRISRGNG